MSCHWLKINNSREGSSLNDTPCNQKVKSKKSMLIKYIYIVKCKAKYKVVPVLNQLITTFDSPPLLISMPDSGECSASRPGHFTSW
jgi:hypothetical protein